MLMRALVGMSICLPVGLSLICSETDEYGQTMLVSNSTWRFCGLITASSDHPDGYSFGMDRLMDEGDFYRKAFQSNNGQYSILSVCLMERYNVTHKYDKVEYVMRCVCNYDRCNRHHHLHTFLKGLKHDNP